MKQLKQLDADYPGGLQKYITNAKKLLEESRSGGHPNKLFLGCDSMLHQALLLISASLSADSCAPAGKNAFEGYVPSVPKGEKLDFGSKQFREFEEIGEPQRHSHPPTIPALAQHCLL